MGSYIQCSIPLIFDLYHLLLTIHLTNEKNLINNALNIAFRGPGVYYLGVI